ncbi:MAG TPA: hypothetical protein VNA20_18570 [Frankiaceae bacterium]|nr:hypothetical protein [Frankiaceae bacterium]
MGVRPARVLAALLLVPATVVFAPTAAHAGDCAEGTYHRTFDVRTGSAGGVALPLGAADPDWLVGGVAATTTPPVSSYVIPGAGLRWITAPDPYVVGVTRFRYAFDVPGGGTILGYTFSYAADNGVTFELNGAPLGGYPAPVSSSDPSGFNTTRTITVSGRAAVDGVNVFDALVQNTSGPLAVLVSGEIHVCSPAATCHATGLAIRANGSDVVRYGDATAVSSPASGTRPHVPGPVPPSPAVDNAAALAFGSNTVTGVATVSYRGVYGRCVAGTGYAAVYGEAGVAEVVVTTPLTTPPTTITLRGVDERAELYVDNGTVVTTTSCDTVDLTAIVDVCAPPLNLAAPPVSVIVHDVRPVPNDGRVHSHRAAIHVFVDGPGTNDVEVIVGAVDVGLAVPATPPPV